MKDICEELKKIAAKYYNTTYTAYCNSIISPSNEKRYFLNELSEFLDNEGVCKFHISIFQLPEEYSKGKAEVYTVAWQEFEFGGINQESFLVIPKDIEYRM